jgi:predicted nucleotidyltransferase
MRRDHVIDAIRRAEQTLRQLGVASAAVFGSVARGDDDESSDVDIAVSPASGVSITPMALLSLYGVLGDTLGYDVPIDVVVLPTRNQALGEAVRRDSIFAFT